MFSLPETANADNIDSRRDFLAHLINWTAEQKSNAMQPREEPTAKELRIAKWTRDGLRAALKLAKTAHQQGKRQRKGVGTRSAAEDLVQRTEDLANAEAEVQTAAAAHTDRPVHKTAKFSTKLNFFTCHFSG